MIDRIESSLDKLVLTLPQWMKHLDARIGQINDLGAKITDKGPDDPANTEILQTFASIIHKHNLDRGILERHEQQLKTADLLELKSRVSFEEALIMTYLGHIGWRAKQDSQNQQSQQE